MEKRTFTMEIGDWGADGHGGAVVYKVAIPASGSDDEIRDKVHAAFRAAQTARPDIDPTTSFCKEYRDDLIPQTVRDAYASIGVTLPERGRADDMIRCFAAFVRMGDPSIDMDIGPSVRMGEFQIAGDGEREYRHATPTPTGITFDRTGALFPLTVKDIPRLRRPPSKDEEIDYIGYGCWPV